MSQAELEKRIKDRQTAYLYVSIYQESNGGFFGLLADLSKTGFKITSETEIPIGQVFKLAIKNPHMDPANQLNFFSAHAKWSEKRDDHLYESGLQFVEQGEMAEALFSKLESDFESTSKAIRELDTEKYVVDEN